MKLPVNSSLFDSRALAESQAFGLLLAARSCCPGPGKGGWHSVCTHCRSARAHRGLGWSAGARCARDSRRRLIGACWHPCRSQQGAGGGRRVRQHARIRRSSRVSACRCRWHRPFWPCRNLRSTLRSVGVRAGTSGGVLGWHVGPRHGMPGPDMTRRDSPGNEVGDEDSRQWVPSTVL